MSIQDSLMIAFCVSNLGFVINAEKSILEPTKKMIFLGNVIDSENMIVELPQQKKDHIKMECKALIGLSKASCVFLSC